MNDQHAPSAMTAFWSEVCGVNIPLRCRGWESAMCCRANASVECATQHSAPSVCSRPDGSHGVHDRVSTAWP